MAHTVLAVPVRVLDEVVRERTRFYDASFVSADPGFVHAHITLLAHWVRDPSPRDLAAVRALAAGTRPFRLTLERLDSFPDGVIHLRPEPDDELRAMTARLVELFPEHPPYGGRYGEVDPHLTLDRHSPDVTEESVMATVAHLLPATVDVDRVDVQLWANHGCRLLHSFALGGR